MRPLLSFFLLAAAVGSACTDAAAQEASFVTAEQSGPGLCQGALPQFAGTLRARPMALANEGTTTAFATCVLPGFRYARGNPNNLGGQIVGPHVYLLNSSGASATVSCTFVRADGWTPHFVTRTAEMQPGWSGLVRVAETDFEVTQLNRIAISCALPPQTAILDIHYHTTDRT